MTFAPKTAAALATVLFALAACGGGNEEQTTPAATETAPAAAETAAPVTDEAPVPGETPSPEPTPTEAPSPTPTASPAAARTAAAATAAASGPVAEPASFAVCKACHSVEPGKNGIGPTLAGVWNARAGHVSGFDYSEALLDSGLVWNQANLDKYLLDPRGVVPGTKMAFAGVKDAAKRQEIIDYLKGL
ncbi:MAG TPA: cytochrome c family protein [Croceibacterium sp.]|nr:cytochrome c family protein [Croceibacterium sp.]